MKRDSRPLLEKIAAMRCCVENDSMEDAFEWTLEILDELHDIEKKKRAKIEAAIVQIVTDDP